MPRKARNSRKSVSFDLGAMLQYLGQKGEQDKMLKENTGDVVMEPTRQAQREAVWRDMGREFTPTTDAYSFTAKATGTPNNILGKQRASEINSRIQQRNLDLADAQLQQQNAEKAVYLQNALNILAKHDIVATPENLAALSDLITKKGITVAEKELDAKGAEALARKSEAGYKEAVSTENLDELLRTRDRRQNITDLELSNTLERLPVEGVRDVLKAQNEATKFGDETIARSAITPGEIADRSRLEFDADMTKGLLLPQTLEAEAARANEVSLSPGQAIVGRREGYRPLATSSFKPFTPKSSSYGDQVTSRILGEDTGMGTTTSPIVSPSIESFEIKESSLGTVIKNKMTGKSYLLPK